MMENFQDFAGKVAMISGGSQGLGLALAQLLSARGFSLIITGRHSGRLNKALELLRSNGGVVHAAAGDVSDERHRRELVNVVAGYGRLDLLVNNASTLGPLPMPALADTDLQGFREALEINTIAPLALVQATRPYLFTAGGLVINISSDAALGGYEGWGVYGASKAAFELLSLTLANELGPQGISVVTVDPGDMRTKMHQDAFPGQDISDRPLPEETLPFWAWLLGQDPQAINGQRFQAQAELWQVAA